MKRLIGTKEFYKWILMIAVPIMIQNGITNFVSLLDNIMVGQVGTAQMSGVAIANQLMFVYNVTIFGAVSGAGIFGAQFFGSGNHEGLKNTFRFKLISCILLGIFTIFLFFFAGEHLISFYLNDSNDAESIKQTLFYGKSYLNIMMVGLIPFALSNTYSSTIRETGETVVPMISSISAVLTNLVFNYILIFGMFGAPKLGVLGAAIATVISRFVELAILIYWTHSHQERNVFIRGVYRSFKIPKDLTGKIVIKGTPLLVNEFLWSGGMAMMMQCYSVRGLNVVAAMNISNTVANVFNIVFLAMGNVVAIVVGQLLGASKMKEAKETAGKLIFMSVILSSMMGLLMAIIAPFFPQIYNTTEDIRHLATRFIIVPALCMPMYAFMHATYFTLRSGGNTIITFLFDSAFVWVVSIPLAYVLTRYTSLNIIWVYLFCQLIEILKCILGYTLVKKGVWLNNMVGYEAA